MAPELNARIRINGYDLLIVSRLELSACNRYGLRLCSFPGMHSNFPCCFSQTQYGEGSGISFGVGFGVGFGIVFSLSFGVDIVVVGGFMGSVVPIHSVND